MNGFPGSPTLGAPQRAPSNINGTDHVSRNTLQRMPNEILAKIMDGIGGPSPLRNVTLLAVALTHSSLRDIAIEALWIKPFAYPDGQMEKLAIYMYNTPGAASRVRAFGTAFRPPGSAPSLMRGDDNWEPVTMTGVIMRRGIDVPRFQGPIAGDYYSYVHSGHLYDGIILVMFPNLEELYIPWKYIVCIESTRFVHLMLGIFLWRNLKHLVVRLGRSPLPGDMFYDRFPFFDSTEAPAIAERLLQQLDAMGVSVSVE